MSRIRITIPHPLSFSTLIPVRITDLNYGGHVGNDTVLTYIHEARVQFLQHHGYSEMAFEGVSLIMADVGIEFKSETFYGDEIRAFIGAAEFSSVGFNLYYKLVKSSDEALVALAKTGMVCFDYSSRKVVRLPQLAIRKLEAEGI